MPDTVVVELPMKFPAGGPSIVGAATAVVRGSACGVDVGVGTGSIAGEGPLGEGPLGEGPAAESPAAESPVAEAEGA